MKRKNLWFVVIACAGLLSLYGFWTGAKHISDFAGYYTSAKILTAGDSIAQMYNERSFVEKARASGLRDSTVVMYVNPPQIALILTPFVRLTPLVAKCVWNFISILLLLVAFELLRRIHNAPLAGPDAPLLAAILACSLPFLRNLQRGQIYVLVLVMLLLLLRAYERKQTVLAAMALALLLLLKYFGWMFLLLFVLERRWKELALTMLFALVGFLATLCFVGAETYAAHFAGLYRFLAGNDSALTGLPCIPALFGSLFTYHAQWNVNPVADLPWLSSLLTAALLVGMIVVTFTRTQKGSHERTAALVVLSVLFTPLAADHHYILLAFPASVFLLSRNSPGFGKAGTFIFAAVLLYAVLGWYPQASMNSEAGWAKLVAFPRVYAAVILWAVFVESKVWMKVEPSAPSVPT